VVKVRTAVQDMTIPPRSPPSMATKARIRALQGRPGEAPPVHKLAAGRGYPRFRHCYDPKARKNGPLRQVNGSSPSSSYHFNNLGLLLNRCAKC